MPQTLVPPSPAAAPIRPAGRYENAAQWWRDMGEVPLERIVMNPWPGTATEADLLRFVETGDCLVELVNGTLVEKTVGSWESILAVKLSTYLNMFVMPRRLGVVGGADNTLRMKSKHVRLPDVCFISKNSIPGGKLTREAIPTLPPTLAIEVLSKGNTRREMSNKLTEYFESGSKLVWYVDPQTKTVAVYTADTDAPAKTLGESDTLDGGDVLPGFTLALKELFDETI